MVRSMRVNASIFLSSVALAGLGTWAASAKANGQAQSWPASMCVPACSFAGCTASTLNVVHATDAGGQLQNFDSQDSIVVCPVVNSFAIDPIPAATNGTVNGWTNGNGGVIAACRTFAAGNGGACGSISVPGFNKAFSVSPDLSAWTAGNANDGYFYRVSMGRKDSAGSVFGIFSYIAGP